MFFFIFDIFSYINSVIANSKSVWILGLFTSIVAISSIISFFIPLKIILLLDSPNSLDKFALENISTNELFFLIVAIFFIAVFVSIFGKLSINKIAKKQKELQWQEYKTKEKVVLKKAMFDRVFKNSVTLYSNIISIFTIFFAVLLLEYILAIFLLLCFFGFLAIANANAKNSSNTNYDYNTIFQILSDSGFYLTFILILALYFAGFKMVLLQVLLAFMLSRVYFRNLNQFFTQLINIYKELHKV